MSYSSYQRQSWHTHGLLHSFQGAVYKAQEVKMIQTRKADFSSTKYTILHSSDQGTPVTLCLLCVTGSGQWEESLHHWSHSAPPTRLDSKLRARAGGWGDAQFPFPARRHWLTHSHSTLLPVLRLPCLSVHGASKATASRAAPCSASGQRLLTVHPSDEGCWFTPPRQSLSCCLTRVGALFNTCANFKSNALPSFHHCFCPGRHVWMQIRISSHLNLPSYLNSRGGSRTKQYSE